MTQEFHISVTPIGDDEYLVRTERVAPGVPLAEEQVSWPVDEWLERAALLMNDPLTGLLRGDAIPSFTDSLHQSLNDNSDAQAQRSINLIVLGQHLYNALFQGTIRDSWMTAQGIAQHRQEILRLRLGLKDNRLPRLPWEVLHAGDRPLATGTDVLFSRYNSSFAAISSFQFQQLPVVEPGQPLKILLVLSAPSDQEVLALKQEALHLQEELQGLQNGNRNGRFPDIQLTILEQPGREQLTQALEHNHYQVLHYAGHSNLGTAGGKLYLVSNKTGLTEALSGDDLAGLLVNNGIRMAVFNSCRGAHTATMDGTAEAEEGNLAEALVKRGIPAVLAMAERIPDDVALNLSRLFYRNLKQLYPIDLSLSRARQGLLSSYGSNQMYWALPILYLHPEFDGYLQPPTESADRILALNSFDQPSGFDQLAEPDSWEDETVEEEEALTDEALAAEPLDTFRADRSNREEFDNEGFDVEEFDTEEFDEFDEADLLDPDDLEFEDPEYQPELEIAQLVQQLSQSSARKRDEEPLLPAPPSENLLPNEEEHLKPDDYIVLPDNPRYYSPTVATKPGRGAAVLETETLTDRDTDANEDGSVYLELERLLAEAGKPTEAIALCNQAIQENPANPEAYDRLGFALYQQGYLSEAIAAYQQAIRINPALADAHNHLGLALYQQGNVRDAIRAYSRAIQLNPNLKEARHNLDIALRKQGVHLSPSQLALDEEPNQHRPVSELTNSAARLDNSAAMALPLPSSQVPFQQMLDFPRPAYARARAISSGQSTRSLLWAGVGTLGVTSVVLGVWFFQNHFDSSLFQLPLPQPSISSIEKPEDLKKASTSVVVAFATEQLNQGDIQEAKPAIEALLDRGALPQAVAVMTPVRSEKPENATLNFLMGRAAWQSTMTGNRDYSVNDARLFWEASLRQDPNAQCQVALGFAYYTEGNLDKAYHAWLRAIELAGEGSAIQAVSEQAGPRRSSKEALKAYAGLALVQMKRAENQLPEKRARILRLAAHLRQRILIEDPKAFQPDALAKDWMWSPQAIADWKTFLSIQ